MKAIFWDPTELMVSLHIYDDLNIYNDLVWCKRDLSGLRPKDEQSAPNNITDSKWIIINFSCDNYTGD